MKKSLFLSLVMCFAVATTAMADVVYEPLVVDSGFNRDVIAEATSGENPSPCSYAVSYLYGAGSSYYHCTYSMATTSVINAVNVGKMNDEDYALAGETGWPDDPTHDDANRIIRCVDDALGNPIFTNVFWQLAPYDGPNALCLRPDTDPADVEEGLSNQGKGYLKFKKVGCYQKLYFLIVSPKIGTGCTQDSNSRGVYATVHYTDGTSTNPNYFPSIGLSGNPGTKVCKTNIYEGSYKKNTKKADNNPAYACAYEFDKIDPTKLIKSIEFENKKNCTGSIILGITGMTADMPVPGEEASVASNIGENSFVATWEAVEGADSYRLDVAEDEEFHQMVGKYNNWEVATNTIVVDGLDDDNDYYWRIRSVNSEGGQSASSAPMRVKTAGGTPPETAEEHPNIEEELEPHLNASYSSFNIYRTLWRDGYYNTLCLPFDMNATEIAASPLAGATVYAYAGAQKIGGNQLNIEVAEVDQITAGVPYLIRWPNMGDIIPAPLEFHNVTIRTNVGQTVGEEGEIRFVGNIATTALQEGDHNILFLGANNTLYWPNTNLGMKGFRAHFEVPVSGPASAPKGTPARIVMREEVTTGMEYIFNDPSLKADKVLLNGRLFIIREGVRYNVLGMKE